MKKYRVLAALLCAAICFSMTACFKKEKPAPDDGMSGVISGEGGLGPADKIEITPNTPESEPETENEPDAEALSPYSPGQNELPGKENMSGEFEKLAGLPCDQVPWGPGTNFDADGRPTACTALQKQYGGYCADFVRTGEEFDNKVYLTFDEGYENGYTGAILDVLKEKGVSAVFFITLPYAKSQPELVQRMIDEGHVVGNHTAGHPNMTGISPEEGYDEVAELHDYVEENFGYSMYLFRFPEGAFSEQNLALLQKMGYRCVFWSFAYKDWDPNSQMENAKAFDKVTGSLHSGEIFLLHAVSKTNAEILGDVIDCVREKGYTFEVYGK